MAIIGAGPAALSCAADLARVGQGHLFEKRELAGGLSTYGIIVLREPIETALAEVEMIGVSASTSRPELKLDLTSHGLKSEAASTRSFSVSVSAPRLRSAFPGEEHILDGLHVHRAKQADLPRDDIGREVVVIGAGNTAIDCATIARRLGASG